MNPPTQKQTELPQAGSLPTGKESAVSAPVVIPEAFQAHDKDLNQQQLQFVVELGHKFPRIVEAATALRNGLTAVDKQLGEAAQLYRSLVVEVHAAKLNRRESTLLLRGLGMKANRVSEILRVAELPASEYNRYLKGEMGFKAVLALDTAKKKGKGEEVKAGLKKPARKVVIHDIDDATRLALTSALAGLMKKKRVKGASTEWALRYRATTGDNVYVAVTISPPNAGDSNPDTGSETEE